MITVQEVRSRIKAAPADARQKAYFTAVLVLVALLAFGLGRLSALYGEGSDFKIEYPPQVAGGGEYIASKTGSFYFFPWCASAVSIPETNRVYFPGKVEAEAAGYAPGNCKGMR